MEIHGNFGTKVKKMKGQIWTGEKSGLSGQPTDPVFLQKDKIEAV
jgi:hypothetical protein